MEVASRKVIPKLLVSAAPGDSDDPDHEGIASVDAGADRK